MITRNIIRENLYLDSIMLMSLSGTLKELEGVDEASVIMGSEANKRILESIGLLTDEGRGAGPGDLIIAFRAGKNSILEEAENRAHELLAGRLPGARDSGSIIPKSFETAAALLPDANLTLISLPGEYAGREAMKALDSGRHVMIFSDNVPLETEIALKKRAQQLGLLVMGPDCGTAIINGTALGFANVVRRGHFGIIGASGTGIQETSVLLHREGYGITQAIGLGGRDLSKEVKAMSMLQAIDALEQDSDTHVVLLISKPPDPEVAELIYNTVKKKKKEYIVTFLNGNPEEAGRRGLHAASGLEEAVHRAIALYENNSFSYQPFTQAVDKVLERVKVERTKLKKGSYLRGLFSGGTLADEALLILSRKIGDIYSNIPLDSAFMLSDVNKSRGHTVIDLGEDVFTHGTPHPMIDYTLRCDRLRQEVRDPTCGVMLLDVVLGYGAHPDPASVLVPAIQDARRIAKAEKRHICIVASLCGTEGDPQHIDRQRMMLEEQDVVLLPSNAQASRFAGLVLKGEERL
jgi:succinyl-CoA synthetase alpha subunit